MLYGLEKHVLELLPGRVLWQVKQVKAGVRHGKERSLGRALDLEREGLCAAHGDPIAAGEKKQKLLLVLKGEIIVKHGPKVDDGRVFGGISVLEGTKLKLKSTEPNEELHFKQTLYSVVASNSFQS